MKITPDDQRIELNNQRRKVDFDTYDITVEELVRRVMRNRIEYAPVYQRQFRWDPQRQSDFIESLLLGIPIPPLFMATNVDSNQGTRWEVVDGLQRLLTLVQFAELEEFSKQDYLRHVNKESFPLNNLKYLTTLNGKKFNEMPIDIRTSLLDRPIKITVLNDKSDTNVRFDLFERLNTGGITLTPHEVRECVFRGEFTDLLRVLAESDPSFNSVVKLQRAKTADGTPQEYVLRFFAFHDNYKNFDHSVRDFLNDYMKDNIDLPDKYSKIDLFHKTFDFLAEVFPEGLLSRRKVTGVNLYEGVSVGAALAIQERPYILNMSKNIDTSWVESDELRKLTTGATNDPRRVKGRIEFSKKMFLESLI